MKFHIAICDDDFQQRNLLYMFVEKYMKYKNVLFDITLFSSGEELLEMNKTYDILILDIIMSKVSGIDVKEKLFEKRNSSNIIFLTNHDTYIKNAFGKYVYAYVNKKDYQVLTKFIDIIIKEKLEKGIYKMNNSIFISSEIKLIASNGSYCDIYKTDGKIETLRIYLKDIEKILSTCEFLKRIHRSYIVNFNYIKTWRNAIVDVELANDTIKSIVVTKSKNKELKSNYLTYLKGKL